MNRKAHLAYNFTCRFGNEGLLKVTRNHLHCKCGNISETVQDEIIITTDH